MRLWLGLLALWLPVTTIPPPLEGFSLILCGLQLRVPAHGLGVLAVQHLREALAHAQHVRVPAFPEVAPRWEPGRCLKAVIAKLSDRVKATKGRPCLDAALNLLPLVNLITTPSFSVSPCALFTVSA